MNPQYFNPLSFESRYISADICVYGGVSGGAIAACEAARRGLSVVLLEPSAHLGGMTASGLGMTDIGNKHAIGGMARDFYRRVGHVYNREIEWRFEPHVAEEVFETMISEEGVRVFRREFVDKVEVVDARICSLVTVSGLTVAAKFFIDCSYEGDLMARAGVSYSVGRESNDLYGETMNGAQCGPLHQFTERVDPYQIAGDPASGLLPGIDPSPDFHPGRGDRRIQAYNFRMCLTMRDDIHIPFPKPAAYEPNRYILLKRLYAAGWDETFQKFDAIRNGKTDTNNHGPFSTDFIGENHEYPEASYEKREKIFQAHVTYQQGLMWCLANDPDIPLAVQEPMRRWGLCADEFSDTGGWPHALYIREARRMISAHVMTEAECRRNIVVYDPVSMAAYGIDSHNCRRLVSDGRVLNEGDVQESVARPFPISYRSIVPRREECRNLAVPFCLSATHVAFGSIRMEPVFMSLGQAAAIACAIALNEKIALQDVRYPALGAELANAGIVISLLEDVVNTEGHSALEDVMA